MDYDYKRHVNKLILGFLKDHCTSAYKAFLKHNFHQSQGKHIITRVAGLNLEDILRIYSQISEIVQARIEETNYPVEHGSEKLSPIFLKEQLLYILDHPPKHFARSRRTSTESCLTELTESHIVDNDDHGGQGSDVETTPENSLPGNVNYYCSTTKKMAGDHYSGTKKTANDRSSMGMSRRKATRVEKVVVDKEAFPGVMSEKLLQNREFQLKLANTITTVLNSPDVHSKKYGNNDANLDLNTTIKNALEKTENDPMFEEVLQEFLDAPVINPFAKHDTASTTSSEHHVMDPMSPSKHSTSHTDHSGSSEQNHTRRLNSDFVDQTSVNVKSANSSTECLKSINSYQSQHSNVQEHQNSLDTHLAFSTQSSQTETPQHNNPTLQEHQKPVNASNHSVLNTPNNVISELQSSQYQMATMPSNQQAVYLSSTPGGLIMMPSPYYVINQPISMQSNCRPMLLSTNEASAAAVTEVVSIDAAPGSITSHSNKNEATNIQEYLTMYDDGKPSPLVKQQQQKPQRGLKKVHYPKKGALQPRPTVKVEILHVAQVKPPNTITEVKENTQQPTNESKNTISRSSSSSRSDKNMPSVGGEQLNENASKTEVETVSNTRNEESNGESETKKQSSQKDAKSGPKLVTPSPSIVAVQKKTPRSGSHVRNLTFPSPSRMSRSSDAKLCIDKADHHSEQTQTDMSLPICWDAGLRRFVDPPVEKKEAVKIKDKSPRKTRRTPKKVSKETDLNATEIEAQLLEDALVTPKDKKKTSKSKSLSCKKPTKPKESETHSEEPDISKKILSPSNLNASKRNIIDQSNSPSNLNASKRNIIDQSNEAEEIVLLEETPLKRFPITPGTKTSETPFTPMLQANLKSITGGENIFCIDTPNFPITPGMSLMTSYSANYYIFQDDDKSVTNEIKKTEDVKGKQITTIAENDKASEVVNKIEEAMKEDNADNKKRKLSEESLENEKKKPKLSPKKRRNSNTTTKKDAKKKSPSDPKTSAKSKKKPIKTPNSAKPKTRETRSSVLSKLKNNPRNSPRNDSDDQCNFFKASGTNLKKLKKQKEEAKLQEEKTRMNDTLVVNIPQDVKLGQARLNVDLMSNKETELHMALMSARQDYEICHFNEEISAQHDPTFNISSPYDVSILNKKRKIHIFTAQDDEVPVLLSASKFSTLFEMDSTVKPVDKELKENSSVEPLAVKNAKRRSRSDSNSSHHSTSSKKREPEFLADASLLKNVNINTFLSQVHNHNEA